MAGMIPSNFIDDLLSRIDIVDVINRRLPLKKAGVEYQACCPFHDEKTPSFTVSPSKQFYHCFGCGAHGSAIGFVMEYSGLPFPDAIEELASSIGVEVPREGGGDKGPNHRPLYDILEKATRFYEEQLRNNTDSPRAVAYLKDRGLSGEVAGQYRMGFAPAGWDNLLKALGTDGDTKNKLRKAGLISEPDGKCYDRFRERIMFPITDNRGRTIAFGGRVLGDGAPKYLNSPETPVFHKGRELYGLYELRKKEKNPTSILVVEGYMDVVALAQFGINNVVATLGTATTTDHLEKLYRIVPEVIFCFDGDRAGKDAAWKALKLTLPMMKQGRQARFFYLPDGEDPDTLVRGLGADMFKEQASSSLPLSEALMAKLIEEVDMESIDGRSRLVEIAKPYIEQIPAGVFRNMLEEHLASLVGTRQLNIKPGLSTSRKLRRNSNNPNMITPAQRAIALLLQYPDLGKRDDLPQDWRQLSNKGIDILKEILSIFQISENITTASLVERWDDENMRRHLAKMVVLALEVHGDEYEQFCGALIALGKDAKKDAIGKMGTKRRASDLSEEEKAQLRKIYE